MLLIYCLPFHPLFVGVVRLILVLLFSSLCPSFEIILIGKRKLVALLYLLFLVYCDCKCSAALPVGAVVWYSVFDHGIS